MIPRTPIGIYVSHVRFRQWPRNIFQEPFVTYYLIMQDYLDSDHDYKFAFFSSAGEDSLAPGQPSSHAAKKRVNNLQFVSDRTFLIDSELHDYHLDLMQELSCARPITWVLPGPVHDSRFSNDTIMWAPFIERLADFYKTGLRGILEKLDTKHYPKPRTFDALLGRKRMHRDFVHDRIVRSGIRDRFVLSYQGASPWKKFIKNGFIIDPDLFAQEAALGGHGTNHAIAFNNAEYPISAIISSQTYNNTAYSLVTETQPENLFSKDLVFVTEKTVKPLIAMRPFVIFSVPGFLDCLRTLGFHTFDNIIDESYDQEPHDQRRWSMAWQQVLTLLDQDQVKIRRRINESLQHNRRVVFETDWPNFPVPAIRNIIESHGGLCQCLKPQ